MRRYPIFTTKEIDYVLDLVMKSDTELFDPGYGIPVKSFTPFKNDLANSLNKYKNVIRERNYHIVQSNEKVRNTKQ